MAAQPQVILGVSAGIAAYKACELLRRLTESGHRVRVIPTPDALRFVGEPTWAALSGQPVTTGVWTGSTTATDLVGANTIAGMLSGVSTK